MPPQKSANKTRRILKIVAWVAVINLAVVLAVAAAMAIFFRPAKPPAMASITKPFAEMDLSTLPVLSHYQARDSAALSYRAYQGIAASGPVIVLIHGSAGSSSDVHPLATALQQQLAATVLVPDLRGHGANQPHGDIRYLGQMDDDIEDMVHALKPAYANREWVLVGFSSGGGFALRLAGEAQGQIFHRVLLLSPFLRYDAPTERPQDSVARDDAHWYSVSIPRIVGLSILNTFGIHALDGLPVIAFPVPDHLQSTTPRYSFRLMNNFAPHDDYRADIRRTASKPLTVLVGGNDDLFLPEQFAPVFQHERRDTLVHIVPGMGHSDMITQPAAIQAAVEALQ